MDPAGNLYVVGAYLGRADFDPGAGVFAMQSHANPPGSSSYLEEAFVLKLTQDSPRAPLGGNPVRRPCPGR